KPKVLAAERKILMNTRLELLASWSGSRHRWVDSMDRMYRRESAAQLRCADDAAGKKRLPEGWLLSTSGSAPRHEAVFRDFVVSRRLNRARRSALTYTIRVGLYPCPKPLSIK